MLLAPLKTVGRALARHPRTRSSGQQGKTLLFLKKKKQKDFYVLAAFSQRSFFAFGLAAALLSGCDVARAQDAAPADPIMHKVMSACGYGDLLKIYLGVTSKNFADAIAKAGSKPDAATVAKIDGQIRPVFENLLPQLEQIRADVLTSKFTGQELEQLAAFCATPLGMKLVSVEVGMQGGIYALYHPAIQAAYKTAWLEHRKDFLDLGLVFKENAK